MVTIRKSFSLRDLFIAVLCFAFASGQLTAEIKYFYLDLHWKYNAIQKALFLLAQPNISLLLGLGFGIFFGRPGWGVGIGYLIALVWMLWFVSSFLFR